MEVFRQDRGLFSFLGGGGNPLSGLREEEHVAHFSITQFQTGQDDQGTSRRRTGPALARGQAASELSNA